MTHILWLENIFFKSHSNRALEMDSPTARTSKSRADVEADELLGQNLLPQHPLLERAGQRYSGNCLALPRRV